MQKLTFIFSLGAFFCLASCNSEKTEEKKEIDPAKNQIGAIMKMGEEMKKASEQQQERIAKGDSTLAPIHYEELYKYLPESISGYTKGEPTGATMTAQGLSYSSAEVTYKNDKGEKVKIALIDYSTAFTLYSMATAMWGMGMSVDTPTEKAKSIKIGDKVNGWESFKKKSNKASAILGIGDRFLLSVEADNQENTDFVKDVAGKIDLKTLAAL